MKSEKDLVKKFNRILDEIDAITKEYQDEFKKAGVFWFKEPRADEMQSRINEKITELEEIGIDKIKLEESINSILNRVDSEIRRILHTKQLTETEEEIRKILHRMKVNAKTSPHNYIGEKSYSNLLRQLNVSEADLIVTNERVMRIVKRLVDVAESEID